MTFTTFLTLLAVFVWLAIVVDDAGKSLKRAAVALERIAGPAPAEDLGLTGYEVALCEQGKRIEAIKHLRSRTGCPLREAKEIVDQAVPPLA